MRWGSIIIYLAMDCTRVTQIKLSLQNLHLHDIWEITHEVLLGILIYICWNNGVLLDQCNHEIIIWKGIDGRLWWWWRLETTATWSSTTNLYTVLVVAGFTNMFGHWRYHDHDFSKLQSRSEENNRVNR